MTYRPEGGILIIMFTAETLRTLRSCCTEFTPTLQKSEGFRVKATEGEVVVLYFEPSATQNLKSSGFPEG